MVIDLRVGERLSLSVQGDPSALSAVVLEPEHKTGALVRLRIVAPPEGTYSAPRLFLALRSRYRPLRRRANPHA